MHFLYGWHISREHRSDFVWRLFGRTLFGGRSNGLLKLLNRIFPDCLKPELLRGLLRGLFLLDDRAIRGIGDMQCG